MWYKPTETEATNTFNSSLREAATSGKYKIVKALLEEIHYPQYMKDCALEWSVRNRHANVVKLLLDSGADHLSINKFLINEYPEVIDILQQHMIDKYEKEKYLPIYK